MAWEYPKHACGHDGERVQMYGPGKGRTRKLAAIERADCPACRAAKADAKCPELPPLIGSEKQVAWASQMRAAVLADPAATLAGAGLTDEEIPYALRIFKAWAKRDQAKWWIDTRESRADLKTLCAQVKRQDEIRSYLVETGARMTNK